MKAENKQGWAGRGKGVEAPHKDRSITVEPIRMIKDINKIKEYLKDKPRDFALFVLGINSGLRGSDLLKLKFKHILKSDGTIKTKGVSTRLKKTKKIKQPFALSSKTRKALAALVPKDPDDIDRDAYIFPSRKSGKMSIQRLHQLVNEWCDEIGLDGNYGRHTLRKTFAYQLLKKSVDLHLLMKALNHSSPSVTLRYAGVEQEDIDNAILKLNL